MNERPLDRKQSLDERLARDPILRQRLHEIVDRRDQWIASGCSLDEVEGRLVEQIRLLGQELMGGVAQAKADHAAEKIRREHPSASRDVKKKVIWFTTLGPISVQEEVLRMGRRGQRFRPFCQAFGVEHRDYSRKLQRAMTDFGAEESFGRASGRIKEHYGIAVSSEAIRLTTLTHGKVMAGSEPERAAPAKEMVTGMDGSLIPVVQSGTSGDHRKGKTLFWREVRVCLARDTGKARGVYGATLGTLESCSLLWEQTARFAGLTPKTYVHGLGDGAPWILEKFNENFSGQGEYLLDFFHVSQYLAQAGQAIVGGKKARSWLGRQQGRLLHNEVAKVLRSLKAQVEPENRDREKTPVRNAWRYIEERRGHMDYQKARERKLPLGSGEIESTHRHLVQQRLKVAGAWWKETNAQLMLNLRTARANGCWDAYWSRN